MKDLLAGVEQRWIEQRLAHGPPASPEDISAFEARYRVRLPADLRAYFMTLNGSHDASAGPCDEDLISFWHLAELRPFDEPGAGPPLPPSDSLFVFADWSINALLWAVQLSGDSNSSLPVFLVGGESPVEVAPSFAAFLEGYLTRNMSMLFGGS
ncbi:MAG: SMI1/KNR4 family protein [Planctomycetes bacterium]|nr:SMI1/KNR4 family protein [Planctomycetota bacterium]MBI3843999.1 SMI1/KNR4 family protein [Planctomycetota bacterium]